MNRLDDTFTHRVKRQLSLRREKAILPRPNKSIVTFTFDDCPLSVVETALPLLEAEGWQATLYVCVGLCGITNHLGLHMSEQDFLAVHKRGHEIADHTFSHINAKVRRPENYLADIEKNQAALAALGLPPSRHFAYPFGDVTTPIKSLLRGRFLTLRGVRPPKTSDMDANYLPAMPLYSGADIEAALEKISTLDDTPLWLNFFTHDVRENPSKYGCTPSEFERIVKAVKATNVDVLSTNDAFDKISSNGRVAA